MTSKTLGVLHPGLMGISLANSLVTAGHNVCWASDNRSRQSAERAAEYHLTDCKTLAALSHQCEVLFSVCPPAEALNLAQAVVDAGFSGMYVDCNAVAPETTRAVAKTLTAAGADFVDGGIIGPPAWKAGTTRLYLSGKRASVVAQLFNGSLMDTVILGDSTDAASALKMSYAAWTKGSAALLLRVYALAEHHGLGTALVDEWNLSQPGLKTQLDNQALINAPKAWRFVGEMEQIAATLTEAGQHPGAFDSAANVYHAMSSFKDADSNNITTEAVIAAIVKASTTDHS